MKTKLSILFILMVLFTSCVTSPPKGETPIITAARKGKIEQVKALLASGSDINSKYRNNTPLTMAIKNNHFEIVKFLVEKGADLESGELLLLAIGNNGEKHAITKYLIENGAPQTTRVYVTCFIELLRNETVLKEEKVAIIKEIIGDSMIDSSFLLAVKSPWDYDYYITSLPIDISAEIPGSTMSLLHMAAFLNNPDLIQYLLGTAYDVNTIDSKGTTPLAYAIMAYGPNINWLNPVIEDSESVKINYISDMPYFTNPQEYQKKNIRSVKLLLDHNADINLQNQYGWNAFHFASYAKPAGLIELLRTYETNESVLTNFNRSPLDLAIANKNQSAIDILKEMDE